MLLKLPNKLEYQDAVLIVQDDDQKKKWLEYIQDLNTGFGNSINAVESVNELIKNRNGKKFLSEFDLLIMDEKALRKRTMTEFARARHFPFPVKLKSQDATMVKKAITEIFESTSLLLHGGKSFDIKVAKTESMTAKEAVENVLHTLLMVTAVAVFCGSSKNNLVFEASMSTTKSNPIHIFEN